MKLKVIYAMTLSAGLSLSFVTWSGVVNAQPAGVSVGQDATVPTNSDLIDGEIRKVDKVAGKLTIKHGAIKSLDMPSMTMIYQVRNEALLENAEAGDKVRFRAKNLAASSLSRRSNLSTDRIVSDKRGRRAAYLNSPGTP
ncbi:copper-binding protein [Cupriavidus consociatus]|uniref:copper-binding protein n=1 Tax=Cupriavidus consociatus TaxID=2821357 RepID=UPI001AE1BF65|nr:MULTISPECIES: copper-binding protein [unclassified Cupriavidus]MBP0623351.1 copper-binding protein [Cupriavidus sp. LEh25]MDK2660049.1 copper-binding protein [Cupriavidus sp. LEh21]